MFKSSIRPAPSVVFREVDGEAIVLNPVDGQYYGLDEVATDMWLALIRTGRVETAHQTLLAEYDVSRERLREDLLGFVKELRDLGLVEVDQD